MIRALIVSDRPVVVDGLRTVLEADEEFEVVGTAVGTGDAVTAARSQAPDVAVVDARIEGENGDGLVGELRHVSPLTECVVLSASGDAGTFRQALLHGAHGYLLDGASCDDIRLAMRRVAAGRSHIDPGVSDYLMQSPRANGNTDGVGLTARELDVLRLTAQGMTNAAIASHLKIKPETVKTHLSRSFERLGARDRAHAVAICMRRGLF